MKTPYLIQRAKFEDRIGKTGIDSLLSFDYMGSSEFEWGALPKALKSVRENISKYVTFNYSFKDHPDKVVTVFCKQEQKEFVGDILEQLAQHKIRLKERCDLNEFLSGNTARWSNDFWWDIDQDWMFWKFNNDFESKFKNALTNV